MLTLSIDCSTTSGSIALFDGDVVIATRTWHEERARHEGLFDLLAGLQPRPDWIRDVDLFAVGRGPGAYSGLRVSLLAAQALAGPGGRPVIAVSSMEAMARSIVQSTQYEDITVIGDARRDSIWVGRLTSATSIADRMAWTVVGVQNARSHLVDGSTLVTPHWDALASIREKTSSFSWLTGSYRPTAEDVGRLAMARLAAHAAPEPLTPLYMHPAV